MSGDHDHVWRTDGMHQNEFCAACFMSKPRWARLVDSGEECSTHDHMHADKPVPATWRFEAGGIGSYYCETCKKRIEANLYRLDPAK